MMVLFEPMLTLPTLSLPLTTTTAGVSSSTADLKADAVETVTGVALPPPVVPPFCVAYPSGTETVGRAQIEPAHTRISMSVSVCLAVPNVFGFMVSPLL
jgi:hypothetical protein